MSRAPSKLTPDVQQKVIAALSIGAKRKHAAGVAGVTESDVKNWVAMGKAPGAPEPYASFYQAVLLAENGRIVHALNTLHIAAGGDWKAAVRALQLWDPDSFGDRTKFQVKQVLDLMADVMEGVLGKEQSRLVFEELNRRTGGELGEQPNEEARAPAGTTVQ